MTEPLTMRGTRSWFRLLTAAAVEQIPAALSGGQGTAHDAGL
jgi:hypothetical protein